MIKVKLASKDRPRGFRRFLGYAVFYDGKPFPSSPNTVTTDKVYLMAHALFKLNTQNVFSGKGRWDDRAAIRKAWKANRHLTLRRVYAEGL